MGDHRASIKIEMSFHGVEGKCDMWINYSDFTSEVRGIDRRVVEWLQDIYDRGMEKYNDAVFESQREERERKQRESDLATLARLKAKYEP